MTSKQLLKARDEGAKIRVCLINGDTVQYAPRQSGDYRPWFAKDAGPRGKRYAAAECIAIDPNTGRPWSGRTPAA
jgi:hypothetical protein